MLALAAVIVFQNTSLPDKSIVDYSGIPTVSGGNVAIQSHSATLMIFKDHVDVSSLTLVKNNGGAGNALITISQMRGGASDWANMRLKATWANSPVVLGTVIDVGAADSSGSRQFAGSGAMKNLGTYALRVNYTVPLGKCGLTHDQKLAAYDLSSPVPIGTMMVSYKYAQEKTFDEPVCAPSLGWQKGEKGAFVRVENYDGKAGLSYAAFYSGWFN